MGDAPFELDTWPRCAPWQRAGQITPIDEATVWIWAERAQLELELEIDRRFDALADQIRRDAWPALEAGKAAR